MSKPTIGQSTKLAATHGRNASHGRDAVPTGSQPVLPAINVHDARTTNDGPKHDGGLLTAYVYPSIWRHGRFLSFLSSSRSKYGRLPTKQLPRRIPAIPAKVTKLLQVQDCFVPTFRLDRILLSGY